MYLVHDVVIYPIELGILPTVWNITETDGMVTFELGLFTVVRVVVLATFLAADLFTSAPDNIFVRFAKCFEERLTVGNGEHVAYQRLPISRLEMFMEMRMQKR